jgi:hypothetical protein
MSVSARKQVKRLYVTKRIRLILILVLGLSGQIVKIHEILDLSSSWATQQNNFSTSSMFYARGGGGELTWVRTGYAREGEN